MKQGRSAGRSRGAALRVCTCASLLLLCSGDASNHKLELLFPDTNLQFNQYGNEKVTDKGSYAKAFDQMFPVRVECWCHRSETGARKGLYDNRCTNALRKQYKWYYSHGVSTLTPQDGWLADAKHYWVKEESCEYTHPWDQEEMQKAYEGEDGGFDPQPPHIYFCKGTTSQCRWDLHWTREDPAYKLEQDGFRCRRCPLYLAIEKKKEVLGEENMSFDELSLPTRAGWTPFQGWSNV